MRIFKPAAWTAADCADARLVFDPPVLPVDSCCLMRPTARHSAKGGVSPQRKAAIRGGACRSAQKLSAIFAQMPAKRASLPPELDAAPKTSALRAPRLAQQQAEAEKSRPRSRLCFKTVFFGKPAFGDPPEGMGSGPSPSDSPFGA